MTSNAKIITHHTAGESHFEMCSSTAKSLSFLCDRPQTVDFLSFLSEKFNQSGQRTVKAAQEGLRPLSPSSKVKATDGTDTSIGL